MKSKKLLSIFALAIALVGLSACSDHKSTDSDSPEASTESVIESAQNLIVPTVLAQNENFQYETFSSESFDELKGNEAFAVFVHSESCGSCAKKNKQIIEEIDQFTQGRILKIQYEEAPQEFLKAYGVTKYDTFVTFDAAGTHTVLKGGSVEKVRDSITTSEGTVSSPE